MGVLYSSAALAGRNRNENVLVRKNQNIRAYKKLPCPIWPFFCPNSWRGPEKDRMLFLYV